MPVDTLAHRFLLVRTQLGLDRKAFAALCGLTENQLQGIEHGRSPHQLAAKVQKVHEATGVDRTWLMFGGSLRTLTADELLDDSSSADHHIVSLCAAHNARASPRGLRRRSIRLFARSRCDAVPSL